ncbi:FkbM family methyltransferase [Desulfovibrio inopinatus]|uniref:FkbM family methyltransferase n=1 Tax=Desulfovibrio inopinatus TaxID=102109 RepID=UPI00042933AC|nr:FkbM family methyltransferase [Desulfovibrio inopinatus]
MAYAYCAAHLPARELYIYGAGSRGRDLLQRIRLYRPDITVLGFIDSNKEGTDNGLHIHRFQQFALSERHKTACIVIASQYAMEIRASLLAEGFTDIWIYETSGITALTESLFAHAPTPDKLTILDVGSRFCEGNFQEWDLLLPPEQLHVIGFDPGEGASEDARRHLEQRGVECEMYPLGLWSKKGTIPFYDIAPQGHASCYPLNEAFVKRLRYALADGPITFDETRPVGKIDIEVDTLDTWWGNAKRTSPDFAKLDIQGGELEVLKGGTAVLDELVGLKVEVWFAEFYKGAPMFSDVDIFVRKHGFNYSIVPTDAWLPTIHGRKAAPVNTKRLGAFKANGQTVTADVFFLRDPIAMDFDELCTAKFFTAHKMLALVALCECFAQYDFALELAQWLPDAFNRAGRQDDATWFARACDEGTKKYITLEKEESRHAAISSERAESGSA